MKIEFISSLSKVKGGDCLEPHLGKDPAATGPGLLLMEQYVYHERTTSLLGSLSWKAPHSAARPRRFPPCHINLYHQIYLELNIQMTGSLLRIIRSHLGICLFKTSPGDSDDQPDVHPGTLA